MTNHTSATAQIKRAARGEILTYQMNRHIAALLGIRVAHCNHELFVISRDIVIQDLDSFLMEASRVIAS